jgi:hypothetical protein
MLNKQTSRRILVALLVLLGAIMIFLTTEALFGTLLMTLGIVIEAVSIAIRRK